MKTGLKDSFGEDIYEGDTIEFSYKCFGVRLIHENLSIGYPGRIEERKHEQVIKYEVDNENCRAGYFLDNPIGSINVVQNSITYKIIKKSNDRN